MKKTALALLIMLSLVASAHAMHVDMKGTVKGKITAIEPSEYEMTIKDEKGRETKVKAKSLEDFNVGDDVVIKGGEMKKAVKPITGGY